MHAAVKRCSAMELVWWLYTHMDFSFLKLKPWSKNPPCTGELFFSAPVAWGSFPRSEDWILISHVTSSVCAKLKNSKQKVCPSLWFLYTCYTSDRSQFWESLVRCKNPWAEKKACLRHSWVFMKVSWHGIWFPYKHFPSP